MPSEELLRNALSILERDLSDEIISLQLKISMRRITFELRNGIRGHIQYNDFGEYGYNVMFSSLDFDRCRFDDYDSFWNVKTKPHHFHPRYEKIGFASPMIGDPDADIALLCKLLKDESLKDKEFRFE